MGPVLVRLVLTKVFALPAGPHKRKAFTAPLVQHLLVPRMFDIAVSSSADMDVGGNKEVAGLGGPESPQSTAHVPGSSPGSSTPSPPPLQHCTLDLDPSEIALRWLCDTALA